jgi:hypothetical protein
MSLTKSFGFAGLSNPFSTISLLKATAIGPTNTASSDDIAPAVTRTVVYKDGVSEVRHVK